MKKFLLFLVLSFACSAMAQSDNTSLQSYISDVDYSSEVNSNDLVIDESSQKDAIIIKTQVRMAQARIYILDANGFVMKRVNSINGFKFELNTAEIKPGKYTVRLINGIDKYEQIWVKK